MRTRALIFGCAILSVVVLATLPAHAQTNAEVNAGIQFNFSTPGARSLGLGGAFFGLADDATAAFTNPAGLTTLSKSEISFEGRMWDYTSTFTDAGHGYGDPTGTGVDTVAGLQMGEVDSDTSGLSFLSFVYPGEGWAMAVYRHELANFETAYRSQGAFTGPAGDMSRYYPIDAVMDLEIVNTGVSFSIRLADTLTIGMGASYYGFDMESVTHRYGFDSTLVDSTQAGGFYGLPTYDPATIINYQEQTGDDSDTAFNFGFIWNLSAKLSLGGVYRQGPEFEVDASNVAGPFATVPGEIFRATVSSFSVPDVYGLGFAYRASDAFTIAFDWAHVAYSSLTDWTNDLDADGRVVGNLFPIELDLATQQLEVDDADELHLGVEYVFVNASMPVAIRFGTWFDPDHKVAFEGDPGDDPNMQTLAALFQAGDDQWHYSAGLGLIFGERFQLDAAADFSDTVTTFALSGVVRF